MHLQQIQHLVSYAKHVRTYQAVEGRRPLGIAHDSRNSLSVVQTLCHLLMVLRVKYLWVSFHQKCSPSSRDASFSPARYNFRHGWLAQLSNNLIATQFINDFRISFHSNKL